MSAYLSLIGRRRGGRLFEAGRLLTFSAFRMGTYSNEYGIPSQLQFFKDGKLWQRIQNIIRWKIKVTITIKEVYKC